MRHILFFIWTALILSSCFNTRLDDTEEKRQQRIKDSIHTDSVNRRRSIPDTTLAIYKRTAFCDTVHVVVFDRVKMLSGKEAADYAERHKRYGNTVNIVVNQTVTLETLAIARNARILLLEPETADSTDTRPIVSETIDGKNIKYCESKNTDIAEGLSAEEIIQIVVQHRSIIYLRQLPKNE